MAQTKINGRQARWLLQLAPYDFTIHYRKGSLNPADGPSRRPDYKKEAEESEDSPMARLIPILQNKLANSVVQRAYALENRGVSLRANTLENSIAQRAYALENNIVYIVGI